MDKRAKKSLHPETPPPEPARRAAPRRATADRRLRILERLRTGLTVTRIRQNPRGYAGEPRDRSAGRLRAAADRPAQRSDDRGAHDDEERDVCATDRLIRLTGEFERCHGFGKPPVSFPAEGSQPRRLAG